MHISSLGNDLPLMVARGIFLCGPNGSLLYQQGTKCNCLFLHSNAFLSFFLQSSGWESTGCWWGHWTHSCFFFLFLSAHKECNGQTIKCAVGSCGQSCVPELSTTHWGSTDRRIEASLCFKVGNVWQDRVACVTKW